MKTKSSINLDVEALKEFKSFYNISKEAEVDGIPWDIFKKSTRKIFGVSKEKVAFFESTITEHDVLLDDFVEVISAITTLGKNPEEVCYLLCEYWIDYTQKNAQNLKKGCRDHFIGIIKNIKKRIEENMPKDELLQGLNYIYQRLQEDD